MNFFLTGNEGFIGPVLSDRLKDNNHTVVGYDLKSGCDILDKDALDKALGIIKYDAIIHLAALTSVEESHSIPDRYLKVNGEGTRNLVELAQKHGIPRFVYAATAASLYPHSSAYAASKLEGEYAVQGFKGKYRILRLFNVAGDRNNPSYSGVIDAFKRGIKEGHITIFGDGEQTRDFVHIGDVCDVITLAGEKGNEAGSFSCEIGSGIETSISTLATTMIGDKKVEILYAPSRQEVRRSVANIEIAKDLLGFRPSRDISEFFV